jgi:predicted RNA-binding Zn-ribbon protein involved in translation (DUF1610 family)
MKIIPAPAIGSVVSAPPLIKLSDHTVEYACGRCGVILMHAEEDQVHNLTISCSECGTYNTTDS